jgi:hypothetical protein
MAKKGKVAENKVAENKVAEKLVDNFVKMASTGGSLNKYGKRNCLSHGRLAQGGQIDQLIFKSFITGKATSFKECAELNIKEAVNNPLTPSRIDAHLQHLIGKHGFDIDVTPVSKQIKVIACGKFTKEEIKAQCNIL